MFRSMSAFSDAETINVGLMLVDMHVGVLKEEHPGMFACIRLLIMMHLV